MDDKSAPTGAADGFIAECMQAWDRIAPSYVRAESRPLAGHLRDLHNAGATADQFGEALEVAFVQPGVMKRDALRYAYGIIRRQLREASHDGA